MTHAFSSHIRKHQHGFSLLELSIALAVIGIVVAGGLTMSTSMVDRTAYVQTGNQMDEVDKAIAAFVAVNNRLPCPADPSLAINNANFGREQAACAGTQSATNAGGAEVRIGALPARTLGLRDRMAADEYGNRYTYAVTRALTTDALVGGYRDPAIAGAITLADTGIEDSAYAVVSHGGDAKGAYRYETANSTVACSGGQDEENCNGDTVFRDTRFNRGSVAGNWFDDTVRFKRKEMINLVAGGANSTSNQYWEANGDHIYNTNTENVGIGIASPAAKLDILAPNNRIGLKVETPDGSFQPAISVETDGGSGMHLESWNTQHVLRVNSRLNENGIAVITNGNDSRSLWIDHAGDNGTGARIVMYDGNSVGSHIDTRGDNSISLQLNATTGTQNYWDSDSLAFRSITSNPRGTVQVDLGTPSSGFNVLVQETVEDFDAQGGNISVRTSCGGGSDCVGLAVSSLNADGTNTGGAHFGILATGGVGGVSGTANNFYGMGISGDNTNNAGVGVYGHVGEFFVSPNPNPVKITTYPTHGIATVGANTNSTGYAVGMMGYTRSAAGVAIEGHSVNTAGTNFGGRFYNASTAGTAVRGEATANSGTTYGGYFTAASATGYALNATKTVGGGHVILADTASSSTGDSIMGRAYQGTGVTGMQTAPTGGYYALYGRASSNTGYGLFASAVNTTGINYGVYGRSLSSAGYGIYCDSANTLGCGGNRTWTQVSDQRLKKNIITLDDAHGLDAIRKLRPVTYEWKNETDKNDNVQIGFIAQEVEAVLPEIVGTGADREITLNGKKEVVKKVRAMGYAELTAPLVKAVQQLADKLDALFDSVKKLFERVDAQDAKIKALEDENKALRDRLDALEAKIAN